MSTPKPQRLALIAVGLVLGGGLAEAALRARYDRLPSLVALPDPQRSSGTNLPVAAYWGMDQPSAPVRPDQHCDRSRRWVAESRLKEAVEPGQEPPLTLLFTGDSFTAGVQVSPEEAFPRRLAQRLSAERGSAVNVVNLGRAGGDFCDLLHAVEAHPELLSDADLVIAQFFADDLEHHAAVVADGRLAMDPARIQQPQLRHLASRSYLANLTWFAIARRHPPSQSRVRDPDVDSRFLAHLATLDRLAETQGAPLIITLLAPTGLDGCPDDPPEFSRCRWLPGEADHIAALLDDSGLPWVDLRTLWETDTRFHTAEEAQAKARGEMDMAIHPDAPGHQRISDALWPAVDAALP